MFHVSAQSLLFLIAVTILWDAQHGYCKAQERNKKPILILHTPKIIEPTIKYIITSSDFVI